MLLVVLIDSKLYGNLLKNTEDYYENVLGQLSQANTEFTTQF